MGRLFLLLFFSLSTAVLAQTKYPEDYFVKPLKIPLILSGTFGELRSNHFHSGLDIKTQKREGFNIHSSAEGYVSRIKISHWGYGKVLYVTHPNGYTSVYAHLKKFAPKIEAYVKKRQYEKESFTIHLFPESNDLVVEKDEIIAYSGNTGGSSGPHLHYEIRHSNSNPINPMFFGIKIPDTKSPEIRAGVVYSFGDSSQVNQSNKVKELRFKKQANGTLLANQIEAYGTIGFGINVIDKLDGALNNNGIFSLNMTVNGETVYHHTIDTYAFSETRYLNTHIDYERYYKKRQRIQKCFVEPANKLSIYSNLINNGYINIEDGLSYTVKITAKDFKGNIRSLIIPVKGKKASVLVKKKVAETPHYFKANEFNKISRSNVTVAFPKQSFYNDVYFDFDYKDSIVSLHSQSVPLHKNFTLTFDVSKYPKEIKKQLFIARKNAKGRLYYSNTRRKENRLYTLNKTLGRYTLALDTIKPKIIPINFKNDQLLTKYRYLKFKVSDNLSGIRFYRGEIDGKWILLEYDAKKNLLTYDFNDTVLEGTKHTLKVTAIDNVKNTNVYIATFYRKE
ncbi:MAG: M23 family metallopeptidase [Flavobacteriaceae bacterium]|nr:M23 family metallopeptidase [Flavobacteriaceae bacterium]